MRKTQKSFFAKDSPFNLLKKNSRVGEDHYLKVKTRSGKIAVQGLGCKIFRKVSIQYRLNIAFRGLDGNTST